MENRRDIQVYGICKNTRATQVAAWLLAITFLLAVSATQALASLNLTGTYSGTPTIEGISYPSYLDRLTLTQTGSDISGYGTFFYEDPVIYPADAILVSGTVSGTAVTLAFADNEGCFSIKFVVTVTAATNDSITGTFFKSGGCDERTSNGTFSLVRSSTGTQAHLSPLQPSGWSAPLVVSNVTGTNTDSNPLKTSDTLYVDWAFINNGTAATPTVVDYELYIDGIARTSFESLRPVLAGDYESVTDFPIGSLGAGAHQLILTADTANTIAESASDKQYTKTITVAGASGGCTPNSTTLCLNGSRFKIQVAWQAINQGTSGNGQAVPITSDTGYFWFFSSTNVELVIKVLDGTPINGHFWVFYGALSNVQYTITVTDTQTGAVKAYFNPQDTFASAGDTSAFADTLGDALVHDLPASHNRSDLPRFNNVDFEAFEDHRTDHPETNAVKAVNEQLESIRSAIPARLASAASAPHLSPLQPSGWSAPLVVSKVTGTNTDSSPLKTSDALYVDWAFINDGTAATPTAVDYELDVDGIVKGTWETDGPVMAGYYNAVTDIPIGSLAAGTHQLTLKADTANTVAESASEKKYTKTVTVAGTSSGCTSNSTTLCLNGGRFRVQVAWQAINQGTSGNGQAVPITSDTGYFWFFSSNNVELIIKVLDGRPINGRYWVFYGALSNVQYTITVTDTQTGAVKTYFNPQNTFASAGDTSAF